MKHVSYSCATVAPLVLDGCFKHIERRAKIFSATCRRKYSVRNNSKMALAQAFQGRRAYNSLCKYATCRRFQTLSLLMRLSVSGWLLFGYKVRPSWKLGYFNLANGFSLLP